MGLQVGDPAPAFSVKDQDGKEVKLSDLKGEKVVLYFYPKDNTPTCTNQACNIRDNYGSLLKKGYKVFGVSPDSEKSHQRFIKKHDLPFPLLADTEHKMVEAGEKKHCSGAPTWVYCVQLSSSTKKGSLRRSFPKWNRRNTLIKFLEKLNNNQSFYHSE
jgi:peroxiredoxin